MKCAKCGKDVPADAVTCPWCAAGYSRDEHQDDRVRCPQCSSADISAVRRSYDPGCGCLGLIIFGWIGLLLGLLGAGKVDLVCRRCGAVWEAGKAPGRYAVSGGCCGLILLIAVIILLKKILFC